MHIGGRTADDVEHVAGRGLVFERFLELARAGLQFGLVGDRIPDPAPDRYAVVIVGGCQLIAARFAFLERLLASA